MSMQRKRALVTIASVFVLTVVAVELLFAAGAGAQAGISEQLKAARDGAGAADTGEQALPVLIARIISYTLGLIGIVLVGLLVYAGWMYMTAGGESDKTEKAKTTIRNAIIGLVIVLSAYSISMYVTDRLLKATAAQGGIDIPGVPE